MASLVCGRMIPGTNQGADQVAVTLWNTCNQRIQAQLLECAQERFDGAVLAYPDDVKSVIDVEVLFAHRKAADQFNPMRWKMREVGVGVSFGIYRFCLGSCF